MDAIRAPLLERVVEHALDVCQVSHLQQSACHRLVDFFASYASGSSSATVPISSRLIELFGGKSQATFIASGQKTSVDLAAAVNAAVAHAAEFDDIHVDVPGFHPGVTVIPAALAVVEYLKLSPTDLFQAIVVGYEIGGKVGAAMQQKHRARGFHSTGTVGALAAAASASYLLSKDASAIVNSIAIATSFASGTFAVVDGGATVKHMHAANAARSGVWSAVLTSLDIGANSRALETKDGFFQAFSGEYDECRLLDGLQDTSAEIERTLVKPYGCCAHAYGAIDIATNEKFRRDYLLQGGERRVKEIRIKSYRAAAILDNTMPQTPESAKLSIPYCFVYALVKGDLGASAFRSDVVKKESTNSLLSKIRVIESRSYTTQFPADRCTDVEIEFEDAQVIGMSHKVQHVPNSTSNVVEKKFLAALEDSAINQAEVVLEKIKKLAVMETGGGSHGDISWLSSILEYFAGVSSGLCNAKEKLQ